MIRLILSTLIFVSIFSINSSIALAADITSSQKHEFARRVLTLALSDEGLTLNVESINIYKPRGFNSAGFTNNIESINFIKSLFDMYVVEFITDANSSRPSLKGWVYLSVEMLSDSDANQVLSAPKAFFPRFSSVVINPVTGERGLLIMANGISAENRLGYRKLDLHLTSK